MNLKHHLKEYLEGISQALFFKNAFFGFSLLGISLVFNLEIFIFGILASLIGYFYSCFYSTSKIIKQTGLMTINGFFFGIAFANLFQNSTENFFCFVVGAMALPLVTKALFEVLQHWKLTPLIFPYILTLWIIWLCALSLNLKLNIQGLNSDSTFFYFNFPMASPRILLALKLIKSITLSISQIFFLQNINYGFCLLVLISLFSPRRGFFFLLGTALTTVVFYGLSKGSLDGHLRFYSGSASLVALGLASLPQQFNWRTIILFSILSLFLTVALQQILLVIGLPVLSFPYVLTFWFALLSRAPRLNVSWGPVEMT